MLSSFDLIHPDLKTKVGRKQEKQKDSHDSLAVDRQLSVGLSVYVNNFAKGPVWLEGRIVNQIGPVSFKVVLVE